MRQSIPVILFAALLVACGSDSSKGADGGTGEVSCADVCTNITALCGQPSGDCEAACETLSIDQRACVAEATSCQQVATCTETQSPPDAQADTDAGSLADAGRACAASGEPCDSTTRCENWNCTCSDGTTGKPEGLCINGTCDSIGLGSGSTCESFCSPDQATNASDNLGVCE